MPRISESLTLATVQYKAVRPQNGDSPAAFREVDANKALTSLEMLNLGVTQGTTSFRTFYRTKASLVIPRHDSEGKLLPSDRFDLNARLGAQLTEAEITTLVTKVSEFVLSDEFKAALAGDAQF